MERERFYFPVRFAALAAPELDEVGGWEAQRWLARQILGKEVEIIPTKKRVEKWGRLLAEVWFHGFNMAEEMQRQGLAVDWEARGDLW